MSNIYVQTRGKNTDYAFLGGAPSKLWWLDFRDATSFEQPTIIVRGDGSEWGCFVSGIQSGRRDRVGTIIRYSLVLEGKCDKEGKNSALALNLLADVRNGQRVQAELDSVFDEDSVEDFLSKRGANPKVGELAKCALQNLAHSELIKPSTKAESWAGSSTSSSAQSEFLARSTELFRGERAGVAAARLNLLGTVGEVQKLLEQQETSLAVLIKEDAPGTLGDEVVSIQVNSIQVKKKASQTKPQTSAPSQDIRPTIPPQASSHVTDSQQMAWKVLVAIVVVVAVLLAITWPTDPTTQQLPTPTIQR